MDNIIFIFPYISVNPFHPVSTSKIWILGSTIVGYLVFLLSQNDIDESIRKYPISASPKMHPSSSGKDLIVLRRLPRFSRFREYCAVVAEPARGDYG